MERLNTWEFFYSEHALSRIVKRGFFRISIEDMLRGRTKRRFHFPRKDQFNEMIGHWKYCIRGKDMDGQDCKVIVTFEKNVVKIITVMNGEE